MSERPSRSQRELLNFIDAFIRSHGYGPSYREVMRALNYKSVSTVAIHVDGLVKKGQLRKRDRSARSLQVVKSEVGFKPKAEISKLEEKWLVDVIGNRFSEFEKSATRSQKDLDDLYVLVGALQVLGLKEAARSFKPKLKM